MARTCDALIFKADDLNNTQLVNSPNRGNVKTESVRVQIDETDRRRKSQDALYRLFTESEPNELNQFVLGLIASGQEGTCVGLLRRLYYDHFEARCKYFMDHMERQILDSQLSINTADHRVACHCLLLVAISVEPEFLSYIVLHTHNREGLRYFLNNVLSEELKKLLQGGFDLHRKMQIDTPTEVPYEIVTFVNNSRHMYAVHCMPRCSAFDCNRVSDTIQM